MSNVKVPLKEIVEEFKDERAEMSDVSLPLYMRLGLQAIRDLEYDGFATATYKQETLSNSQTIPLPDNCVKVIDVYAYYGGNIYALPRKKNIYIKKDDCGNDSVENKGGLGNYFGLGNTFSQHVKNGENIGGWYGAGGQSYFGSYRINDKDDRLEFDTNGAGFNTVVIQYLTTPESDSGEYRVHEFLREPIKNYIDWKLHQRKRISANEKEYLKTQYYDSKHEAMKRKFSFSIEQVKQLYASTYMQSPKGH